MNRGYFHSDPDELRILGLISDEMYYMMKQREAAASFDVKEQKRWIHLEILDKQQKKKKEAEERQKKKQEEIKAKKEQEKAIKEVIEKELPKKIEKELGKQIEKVLSK